PVSRHSVPAREPAHSEGDAPSGDGREDARAYPRMARRGAIADAALVVHRRLSRRDRGRFRVSPRVARRGGARSRRLLPLRGRGRRGIERAARPGPRARHRGAVASLDGCATGHQRPPARASRRHADRSDRRPRRRGPHRCALERRRARDRRQRVPAAARRDPTRCDRRSRGRRLGRVRPLRFAGPRRREGCVMTVLVRPFRALRPRPEHASSVAAPPYDVVDTDEARALAEGKPFSFLHVSRPEIDLPPGTDPYSDAVYSKGAENLARLIESGVLVRDETPSFYVYRMALDGHVQTGVACVASVRAYEENRIRKHELTRPDKENDRVRHIDALNAQTGPVLLAYRSTDRLRERLAELSGGAPSIDADGPQNVRHSLWRVSDPAVVAELERELNALGRLYIADGHHRSAAAARVARARRSGDPHASHEYFLAVAFPHDEMRILDYNRVISDLNDMTTAEFLERLGAEFQVRA